MMAGKANPPATKSAATKATEGERIAKVLSRAGISSRREAERMIELGEVQVNGKTITSPALNVTPNDRITVRGEPVGEPEPARLWLYYKPEGLVTSASDEKGRDTVFDRLPEDMPRVMSVGRLDLNSEGLLLLTNDGELKRRLELPSTGWLRKYRVRVKGNPTDPELEPLRKGIVIDGERFQPMNVVLDRHQGANAWLTVGLREGKNREIRRAIDSIGLIVNRLIRISYGPFRLGDLEPGQVEEIKARVLREQLGEGKDAEDDTPKPRGRTVPRPKAAPGAKPVRAPRPSARTESSTETAPRPRRPGDGVKALAKAWKEAVTPDEPAKRAPRGAAAKPGTRSPKAAASSPRSGTGKPGTSKTTGAKPAAPRSAASEGRPKPPGGPRKAPTKR